VVRFILKRLLLGVLVLFIVSIAVFAIFFLGGDPAPRFCGKTCTPERLAVVKQRLYLDHSVVAQYWHYLHGLVFEGNLGYSFASGASVNSVISRGLPATASLALGAAVLWLLMGIPIGVTAATKPRSIRDRLATVFALAGLSMPPFFIGLLLLYVLFYQLTRHGLHWFPPAGFVPITQDPVQWFVHLMLPWLTLALVSAASYARLTRGTMLEVLGEDYIRTARAKGLSERRVVYRHGLRSALNPIVTMLGIDVGTLLGGTVVVEQLFGLHGIGQAALNAQSRGDLPIVLGTVLVAAFFVVVANIVVDIGYALLDPRVRLS